MHAVGGLTTTEIVHAFLNPREDGGAAHQPREAEESGLPFLPATAEPGPVLHVLYLIFTEGHTSTGPDLQRRDLATEAIRLARLLHALLPDDSEVAGLLALMLLTDAATPAPARTAN